MKENERKCQRNSMFLTRCTSVDSVNSESCSEVVFFCATTVVCKRHRFVFQHSFPSQSSCVVDSALGHDRCVLGLKEKSLQRHLHVSTPHCNKCLVVLRVLTDSLLVMISGCLCKFTWWLISCCADLCWLTVVWLSG